jgi:hypothetical protein
MKLIAHRGNISGREKNNENQPDYISNCIQKGYEAEIDVWHQDGFYLGHDEAQYEVDLDFLLEKHKSIWVHCKNIEALEMLSSIKQLNVFWHEKDSYALTSHGFIWTYPHKKICSKSVIVASNAKYIKFQSCFGVCSDFLS